MDEVVLGWFGPGDPDHPEFGALWCGATLALEQENAAGGYRGKAFRLLPAWSESPWKAGILEVTKLVYERGAWAVIGGVDGTTTHLAVQLALKSYFPLVSPGSTDVTTDHANVPWLFSLPPSDARLAPVIAGALAPTAKDHGSRAPVDGGATVPLPREGATEAQPASRGEGGRAFTLVAGTDHDSHAMLVELRRVLGERGLNPAGLVELPQDAPDLPALARQVLQSRPTSIVLLARATVAGRLVAELRSAGFRGTIVGGPTLATDAFARVAGGAAEGVVVPAWNDARSPEARAFAAAYQERFGRPPDVAAAQGFDSVRLVAAAIRAAGLNRPRIRDALRALAPWRGAMGRVTWNALGRNEPASTLATWRRGTLFSAAAAPREQPPPLAAARP